MSADDLLLLVDDDPEPQSDRSLSPWRILVVDDDPEVHQVTQLVLQNVLVLDRPLHLVHAHSAQEARTVLEKDRHFAVALLDVVMETEDAGLELVTYIRQQLQMHDCRIVLRTGQPGYAPELEVFSRYDINDYHTKTDLTHTRLLTALTSAIRAYQQIRENMDSRLLLERITRVSTELMEQHTLQQLADAVLAHTSDVIRLPTQGLIAAQRVDDHGEEPPELVVLAATEAFSSLIGSLVPDLPADIRQQINQATARCGHIFENHKVTLHLYGGFEEAVIHLQTTESLTSLQQQALTVFASNLSASFANVKLFERLNFAAYHDALTGVANRTQFILDLDELAVSHSDTMVVALIDINHFADLNDGLGQEVGDALLCSVAQRLQYQLGKQCKLARLGADIFGVVGPEEVINPLSLFALFDDPLEAEGNQLPVTVTLGLCRLLEAGGSGISLLKAANIALNRAKKSMVAHYEYFLPEMEDNTRWRLEVIRELRRDFDLEKLDVWFQPQISLATGKVSGMEALIRWPDEKGGFVHPPNVFIPLAEYSGLIVEIGQWVMEKSVETLIRLKGMGIAPERVAVNVSMPQFRRKDFIRNVSDVLSGRILPADCIELEITESIAMDEPKVVQSSFHALKEIGVRIAVDDFGTGYSSLGHLRALPIDVIKIDQMFVREIQGGKGGIFAETIVAMSKKLGVDTVAEGVETTEQAGFLRGLGCTDAQGWLYARAMPLPELISWLQNHKP